MFLPEHAVDERDLLLGHTRSGPRTEVCVVDDPPGAAPTLRPLCRLHPRSLMIRSRVSVEIMLRGRGLGGFHPICGGCEGRERAVVSCGALPQTYRSRIEDSASRESPSRTAR